MILPSISRNTDAPEGCATEDREAWKIANPALACVDPFLAEDGIEAVRRTLREPVFRQLRLGQWVTGAESWMPWGGVVGGPGGGLPDCRRW
jgi:hypothetical protein